MILASTKTTPNFSYGIGIMSPGETITCSMSADGEFNQIIYLIDDTEANCTPLDAGSALGTKHLTPGVNDLSEYMNVPVEFKNWYFGTDLDVGSKYFAIKPRPMTDRYKLSVIEDNQTITGSSNGTFIISFTSRLVVNGNTKIDALRNATVPEGKTVTVNVTPGEMGFLLEKV